MYKVIKVFLLILIFLSILATVIYYNLGRLLDITQKPKQSDIIVCLGGGDGARIKRALELYTQGYSRSNLLVLTGDDRTKKRKKLGMDDKRIEFLKKTNQYKNINLVHYKAIGNTKVEVIFIKKYMQEHHLNSAIIVSDPPHSRRIQLLLDLINVTNDNKLQFNIVSSNVSWWDTTKYYKSKKATAFAAREAIKLVYAYIAFGLLEKIGLYDNTRELMMPYYKYFKRKIDNITYFYLKSTSS